MAQRTIHALLGELILKEEPVKDEERFLLGCILPDAYASRESREVTHFMDQSIPGMRYFDFDAFRARFADRMDDALYLGYYLHLVQDNCYRRFFRARLGLRIDPNKPEQVAALHRDYTILNAGIVARFGLRYRVERPADFEKEPLNAVVPFALDAFLEAYARDFTVSETGELRYITMALLDEYIAGCLPLCIQELRALKRGERYLCARDMAWTRPV